jgi:iron complex transport system ATP-binding protein
MGAAMTTRSHSLEMRNAALAYRERVVAPDLTLSVPAGRITAILGPNGSGKSTVLRALARILRPQAGAVLLDGADIHSLPTAEVARRVAMLPQAPHAPEGMTVRNLIAFGRFPWRHWLNGSDPSGDAPINAALNAVGISALADRAVATLSGGQRQRVWIAMALAQETPCLLLDEPTTFLDLAHQIEVMDLIHRLNRDLGKTVVLVLHDLTLAARYADHVILLKEGNIFAEGAPSEVLTASALHDVFGIEAHIAVDENGIIISCTPIRTTHARPRAEHLVRTPPSISSHEVHI